MTGALLTLLAQGMIVGAAALVASIALRRYPPRLRIGILVVGLCSFLVPFGRWTGRQAPAAELGAFAWPSWLPIVLGIVAGGGALAGLLRLAFEAVALRRLVARSTPAGPVLQGRANELAADASLPQPAVRLTTGCAVPFVASANPPVILLPEAMRELPGDRIDAVLLHEIAHIRGGDVTLHRLLALFSALLWFHPVARLLVRALRQAVEERCDDFAIRRAPAKSYEYAETLVELAASLGPDTRATALSMASGETRSLAIRLRRIAERERQVTSRVRCVAALLVIAAPLLAGAACLTPRFATTTSAVDAEAFGARHQDRHSALHSHHH